MADPNKHDSDSKKDSLISDIAHKHTPDSVRRSAYRELERRGYTRDEARRMADKKHGDFWG